MYGLSAEFNLSTCVHLLLLYTSVSFILEWRANAYVGRVLYENANDIMFTKERIFPTGANALASIIQTG